MRTCLALVVSLALVGCKKESKDAEPAAPAKPAAKTPDAAAAVAVDAAGAAAAAVDAAAAAVDRRAEMLAAVAAAVHCEDPAAPMRVWCIATDGWATATPAALPTGAVVLTGLTLEVADGAPIADALSEAVSVSALALRQDGAQQLAKIINIRPSTDDEAKGMMAAVASLAMLYKGKADVAALPKDLAGYLASLTPEASHPVTAAGPGWTWTGTSTSELRKVGDYWVAIEIPETRDGHWLSIYTDKTKAE